MFGKLFGNSQQGSAEEQSSLLEDWNSYAKTGDVESGQSSSAANDAVAKVGNFLSNSIQSVTAAASSAASSVATLPASLPSAESFSIPTTQQLTHFFAFMAGGGILLLLAFMIFLPVIILSPSKFALSFTLGCLLIMIGFAQLRGWKQQLQHMMSRERLPFSSAYIGSILLTLYAAMWMHSYVLSLVCSGAQVVALLYYLTSYFPGGTQGVKILLNLFWQAVTSCFVGVQRMVLK